MIMHNSPEEESTLDPTSEPRHTATMSPRRVESSARDERDQNINVGEQERLISVATGAVLAVVGLSRGSLSGALLATIGGALVYRGFTGNCPAYTALHIDTAHPQSQPHHSTPAQSASDQFGSESKAK